MHHFVRRHVFHADSEFLVGLSKLCFLLFLGQAWIQPMRLQESDACTIETWHWTQSFKYSLHIKHYILYHWSKLDLKTWPSSDTWTWKYSKFISTKSPRFELNNCFCRYELGSFSSSYTTLPVIHILYSILHSVYHIRYIPYIGPSKNKVFLKNFTSAIIFFGKRFSSPSD